MGINLTGDVSAEVDLKDVSNLEDLIKKFREKTSISYLKPMFENEMSVRINEIKKEKRELVTNLLSEIPLNSQEKDIDLALAYVLCEYISCDLEAKYDCLDTHIFELERMINVNLDKSHKKDIKIPLFANVNFGESQWKFEVEYKGEYRNETFNITSKAPPIPREIKEKAKQFSVDYMNAVSKTFQDPIMGNLLLRNYQGVELPNLSMHWIPTYEELDIKVEVIDKDPILVANNLGRSFLIDNWFVKGEQPYEHYLLEFKKSNKN
jgi:hypothetical protein